MLAPPPAPGQPCQYATVFDDLGHKVEVSKCAPWTSQAHVLCNGTGNTVLIILVQHLYAHSALSLFSVSISRSAILLFVSVLKYCSFFKTAVNLI